MAVAGGLVVTIVSRAMSPSEPNESNTADAGASTSGAPVLSSEQYEFLASLIHELRNPVSAIATALQLMREVPGGDAVGRERGVIERQVANLVRLLDDVRDMTRLGRGRFELNREPTDLVSIAKRALETAAPLAERRGHTLAVDLTPEVVPVEADVARIVQVIHTLVANAVKYTPSGGRLALSVLRETDAGTLRMSDNGVGIVPDLLPHVFDLAPVGNHPADRSHGGLGIGLALAKRILELHGGSLSAESAGRDRGSLFTLRLPLAPIPG
jgi:signal transduction histidine kinase